MKLKWRVRGEEILIQGFITEERLELTETKKEILLNEIKVAKAK